VSAKRLITIDSLTEAHILKGRLLNEGIDCFLTNENFTNLMPLYNNMLGSGIQIFVNEEDFEKARVLLKDRIEPDNLNLVCHNCGSKNIRLGIGKGKIFKFLNIIIAVLAVIPMGNLKPKYYCADCKSEVN